MKNIFFTLFLSVSIYAQESKDYFVLLTSDPMSNPSAAMMSINTASEALNQGLIKA